MTLFKFASLRYTKLALMGFTAFSLSACASSHSPHEISDPFESANRVVFDINNTLDDVIAKPVATGYRYALPEPARVGVRNVLRNLNSPVNVANQTLQADFSGAATDIGRVLINSTLGIGGLFDLAGYWGLEYEPEDFGQTMGRWGIGPGPYFVIPVLGPSSLRDSIGRLADNYADPLRLYLYNTDRENIQYARLGVGLISQREALLDVLEDLENSSIDYYAVMRSSYHQYREAQIRDTEGSVSIIPDYEDDDY